MMTEYALQATAGSGAEKPLRRCWKYPEISELTALAFFERNMALERK